MIHKQAINFQTLHSKRIVLLLCLFLLFILSHSVNASVRTNLYGHIIQINYEHAPIQLTSITNEAEANARLEAIEGTKLASVVEQLDQYSMTFGMDDLAYVLMVQKFCKSVYATEENAHLLEFALLKKKGYEVLFGYDSGETTVYAVLGFKILNGTYVVYKGIEYTDISFVKNLEPCEEQILESKEQGRSIMVNENRPPFFTALSEPFHFYFEFEGSLHFFSGQINKSLVEYYRDLPDIEFGQVYLNYQMSAGAQQAIIGQLKNAIGGMFQNKQIDFLLSFTQNALPYKKDNEQLGKEKFSFPEEVLANGYGDCEDKSVLFAYLAKEVLQLPSIALLYLSQNHLNVAVALSQGSGYNFIYNQTKYLVCEPSGAGFSPGDNIYDLNKASIISW